MFQRQVALCICNCRGIWRRLKLAVDWLIVRLLCNLGLEVQIVSVVIGLAIAITRTVALITVQAAVDFRNLLGVILSQNGLIHIKNLGLLGDAGLALV